MSVMQRKIYSVYIQFFISNIGSQRPIRNNNFKSNYLIYIRQEFLRKGKSIEKQKGNPYRKQDIDNEIERE